MKEGICIQIVGDWSLVPDDLRPIMAKTMTLTRYNTRAKLNVAFAYTCKPNVLLISPDKQLIMYNYIITARNEITRGIKSIQRGLVDGDILEEDVNSKLLEESFYIIPSKPLDLLVRTSGETRLSDFLLWQSTETVLCFSNVLWPEFTYWHLLSVVFQFQIDTLNLVSKLMLYEYFK
jgi:ditrans,polycis-polyprenyl diphosphate synthase